MDDHGNPLFESLSQASDEYKTLREEYKRLHEDNKLLHGDNRRLNEEIRRLHEDNKRRRQDNKRLHEELNESTTQVNNLRGTLNTIRERTYLMFIDEQIERSKPMNEERIQLFNLTLGGDAMLDADMFLARSDKHKSDAFPGDLGLSLETIQKLGQSYRSSYLISDGANSDTT